MIIVIIIKIKVTPKIIISYLEMWWLIQLKYPKIIQKIQAMVCEYVLVVLKFHTFSKKAQSN